VVFCARYRALLPGCVVRERCPQNMFDPILRAFAAAHPSVELRYRTRLCSFVQDADGVSAEVEDVARGRRYQIAAMLGIAMSGNPGAHLHRRGGKRRLNRIA
jgi:hypothetical protein